MKLLKIFQSSPLGIFINDVQGKFVETNDSFLKMTGYQKDEVIGLSLDEIGLISASKRNSIIQKLKLKGFFKNMLLVFKHKSGKKRSVLLTTHQNIIKQKLYYVSIVYDITNQKIVEKRLKEPNNFINAILENIPNMIFVKEAKELRFVRFNKAGEELLGYNRNDLIGKNDYDFFPTEQADFFTNIDRKVLESRVLLDIPEEPIKTKDKEQWLHTKKIPIINKEGNPIYLLGISENITEKRLHEAAINKLNAELEQKVIERTQHLKEANDIVNKNIIHLSFQKKQLEDFCNIISHNLRAPLINITMLSDFINRCDDIEEQKLLTEKLNTVTNELNEIFNYLVESLQIREDNEIKSEDLILEDYLKKTLDGLQGQLTESKAQIEFDFDKSPTVYFPPKYLLSILLNLIGNSLKYKSPLRNPVIKIKSDTTEGKTILSVSDNGLGIDLKKHKDNLFKIRKVFHSHPDAKGFGLYITKTQVESMNGRIWAESVPDEGSTFFVEFKTKDL
ncbi:MAG: PAS domain-containing sensor histidine kinase [Bacteroidales bacterium]|nr:PAS domain-containing sensor histidine kinase [Bacteroidales bacterium]